nr:hypothetical protein [bacterium]
MNTHVRWIFVWCLLGGFTVAAGLAQWNVTVVDGATIEAGKFSALAIDQFDLPHIAYRVENPDSLKYARLQGDTWLYEVPANAGGMGQFNAVALDGNDSAHIAHFDPGEGDLMHTWRIGGSTLDTESVDTIGTVGMECAIDLDSEENPVISYYNSSEDTIRLARLQPGIWIQTVDSGIDTGFTDVRVDASDVIHMVYSDYNTGSLKYARYDGDWTIETVDTGITGVAGALALNSSGFPHVVYVDSNTADIKYAVHDGSVWTVETAFTDATAMTKSIDMVLDAGNVPHVCFFSKVSTLVYANRVGGTWQGDGVDDD